MVAAAGEGAVPAHPMQVARGPARERVSVCMATCNGARFVQAQAMSVLAQLQGDDELVVADDASTDSTVALLRALRDSRIRVLPPAQVQPQAQLAAVVDAGTLRRLGVVRNFERALRAARHEIVFLCDQDDVWLDGKLEHCIDQLQHGVLVVTDCQVVDAHLAVVEPSFFATHHSGRGIVHNLWRNTYLGCCMAFRRELLQHALPIPSGAPMHDMWLGLVAERRGGVKFSNRVLVQYRRHANVATTTGSPSTIGLWGRLVLRARLASALVLRLLTSPRS